MIRILWVLLFAFAGWFAWYCGIRGFFPLDQSIVFDGGYRVSIGELPFRDFQTAHSLALILLQGAVFSLFGVSIGSYVAVAVTLNLIAVGAVGILLRNLFPQQRLPALSGALLTAVWLIPAVGTPYADPAAFLSILVVLAAQSFFAHSVTLRTQGTLGVAAVAGLALAFGFLCKQSVLAIWLPWLLLAPFLVQGTDRKQQLRFTCWSLLIGTGAIAATVVFIAATGSLSKFWEGYFSLPIEIGTARLAQVLDPTLGITLLMIVLVAGLFLKRAVFIQALSHRQQVFALENPRLSLAAGLALYILCISQLLRAAISNNPAITDSSIGILLALITGILIELLPRQDHRKLLLSALPVISIVFLFGIWFSGSRKVHESVMRASFGTELTEPGLAPLHWGQPTVIYDGTLKDPTYEVTGPELEQLTRYLREQPARFFIFPDFTFLYGITGKPSALPLLWFHKGLTYPRDYSSLLDRSLVDALVRADVRIAIVERESFLGTAARLKDFPVLSGWLESGWNTCESPGFFKVQVREGTQCPD
jgi:hypothetical protein